MADTKIIDGKAFSQNLREQLKGEVEAFKQESGITPGLAVVLVGEDPASQVYVRNKRKQTVALGMESFEHNFPANVSEEELLECVTHLNNDDRVHGILVQLPLPDHIDEDKVINTIAPEKDVDGFHTINVGRLVAGQECLTPCTPTGCIMLLKDALGDLSGKHAVVIGRSNIVGKPMAHLLLQENCTVTIAHSRTKDIEALCKQCDIVVAAVGRPEMVKGSWLKEGAVVIDVGINRVDQADGDSKLVGDVAFDECQGIASAITPVPGGVGPMTIACLLQNTLKAASLGK